MFIRWSRKEDSSRSVGVDVVQAVSDLRMYTAFKVLYLLHDLTNLAESRALPQLLRSGSSPSLHRKAYVEADWEGGWGLVLC
jgi:hypothetical protein